jgi:rhamnose transport system permease protein
MKESLLHRISPQTLRLLVLIGVIVLLLVFFASQIEGYLNGRLFNRISSSVAVMALIATGQTLVILTRNIDLSVGSVIGFSAFATGTVIASMPGLNPLLLVLCAALIGGAFGVVNGVLVAYVRVPSIIVTLATMAIFRSLLVEFSGSRSVTTDKLPQWLMDFPNLPLFSLGDLQFRAGFCAAVVVVVLVHLALTRLRPARQLFAVGSNPDAADMAGIDAQRVVFVAFALSGVMAGLAGFMFLARFGTITVVAGLGLELKSVASAVVGGVNIFGGSGSVIGAFLGTILVDLLETSLVRWQIVSEFWREAILGALILISVAADTVFSRRLGALRAARARKIALERKRASA